MTKESDAAQIVIDKRLAAFNMLQKAAHDVYSEAIKNAQFDYALIVDPANIIYETACNAAREKYNRSYQYVADFYFRDIKTDAQKAVHDTLRKYRTKGP